MTVQTTKPITAEELFEMGDIGRCELINGDIVTMSPTGLEHGVVAMRIGRFLSEFVEDNALGICPAAETGYKMASNLVRAPDASFIRASRLAGGITAGFFDGAPDLAVEVVSPADSAREIAEKVNMWFAHGTQVAWVAYPRSRTLIVHRAGQTGIELDITDVLRDEPLLPGFTLALSKVFMLS